MEGMETEQPSHLQYGHPARNEAHWGDSGKAALPLPGPHCSVDIENFSLHAFNLVLCISTNLTKKEQKIKQKRAQYGIWEGCFSDIRHLGEPKEENQGTNSN